MFDTLESAVGTVLAVLCLFVFAAAAVRLIGVALAARRLVRRLGVIHNEELTAKLARAPEDLARIEAVAGALRALFGRAALAVASIAASLATLRSQAGAFGEVLRFLRR